MPPRGTAGTALGDAAASGAAAPAHKSQTAEDAGAAAVPGHPRSVQVRAGETLSGIAVRYLGSSARLGQLVRANPQLHNADMIYPGETVHLPPSPVAAR